VTCDAFSVTWRARIEDGSSLMRKTYGFDGYFLAILYHIHSHFNELPTRTSLAQRDRPEPNMPRRHEGTKEIIKRFKIWQFLNSSILLFVFSSSLRAFVAEFCFHFRVDFDSLVTKNTGFPPALSAPGQAFKDFGNDGLKKKFPGTKAQSETQCIRIPEICMMARP
jgi:hypothetical protein